MIYYFQRYNIYLVFLLFLMASLCTAEEYATDSSATESSITIGAEADFNSRYVWRGIPLSKGAVMQPSVWISASDFTLTLWNNFVLDHETNHGQTNEFDFILAYCKEWDNISIEPSINYYWYLNQEEAPSTGELAVKLAYSINSNIELFTNQYIDVKEYPGAYFGDIGVGYTRDLNSVLTFEGSIGFGWGSSKFNKTYLAVAKNALNVAQGEISLTYHQKNCFYLRPHVAVSTILDNELQQQLDDSTLLYGGIALGKEF